MQLDKHEKVIRLAQLSIANKMYRKAGTSELPEEAIYASQEAWDSWWNGVKATEAKIKEYRTVFRVCAVKVAATVAVVGGVIYYLSRK